MQLSIASKRQRLITHPKIRSKISRIKQSLSTAKWINTSEGYEKTVHYTAVEDEASCELIVVCICVFDYLYYSRNSIVPPIGCNWDQLQ